MNLVYVRLDIDFEVVTNSQNVTPVISFLVNDSGIKKVISGYYAPHWQSLAYRYPDSELTSNLLHEWNGIINKYMNIPLLLVGDTNVDRKRRNGIDKA